MLIQFLKISYVPLIIYKLFTFLVQKKLNQTNAIKQKFFSREILDSYTVFRDKDALGHFQLPRLE